MSSDLTKKTSQGGVKTLPGFSTFSSAEDGAEMDPQEYARLLEFYDTSFRNIAEGEVVKGTVVKVTPTEVIVDVGFKSEGIIPIEEFIDEGGQVTAQPGDTVDVLLERTEDRDGYVVLSREGREDEDLGRGREGLPGAESRHRPCHRTHQRRTGRGHRRPRVPAGLAN
jgi:small subunit ribosomal protein S1